MMLALYLQTQYQVSYIIYTIGIWDEIYLHMYYRYTILTNFDVSRNLYGLFCARSRLINRLKATLAQKQRPQNLWLLLAAEPKQGLMCLLKIFVVVPKGFEASFGFGC